jgi:hypothetical protein
MALESERRPPLRYARVDDVHDPKEEETFAKALDLARKLEELLEDTRSVANVEDPRAHSTRMARAMAASLVDELEALVRPSRKTGSS